MIDTESNRIEWPTKLSTNATNCDTNDELTVQDENLITTNDELHDNIEYEKADNDCEIPTNVDCTIDTVNISALDELNTNFAESGINQSNLMESSEDEDNIKENIYEKEDEYKKEEICTKDDKPNATDSFIDVFDNTFSSNKEENGNLTRKISDGNFETSEDHNAIEQTENLDESIINISSAAVEENIIAEAKDDNGNIEIETEELNLNNSNDDKNLQDESFVESKTNVAKSNSRRPSVEFNVYSPRAPPKIKVIWSIINYFE